MSDSISKAVPATRDPLGWIDEALIALELDDLRRHRLMHAGMQGPLITIGGRTLANFGSNDYLGLAADPRLGAAVANAVHTEGWGAGASPLVTAYAEAHARLETRIAEFEGTAAALLFTSGFAAGIGTIPALVARGDAIFADQKNHACLIDGCRLSRATLHVYAHRNVHELESLLVTATNYRRKLIVTDSVFSMDGDLAPLDALAELARRYDCMLMVDEAHATGIFGHHGRGLAEVLGVEMGVHVRLGTLSKALGSTGGFIGGSRQLVEWLVNRARPYVFSTAPPPAVCAAALVALDLIRDEPWRRTQLLARAAELRDALRAQGWNLGYSESQIVPLFVGDPTTTMRLAADLRERGLLVPGIRPPSVPEGESLLRISLSYAHTPELIGQLIEALGALRTRIVG